MKSKNVKTLASIIKWFAFSSSIMGLIIIIYICNKHHPANSIEIIVFGIIGSIMNCVLLSIVAEWLIIMNDIRNSLENMDKKTSILISKLSSGTNQQDDAFHYDDLQNNIIDNQSP